ncbi:MAG: glycosyltransferase family 4 protein [Proteobacteria bacterium]|nr:glycosyltransferase family 4 protein [Pseudomonadota bacterium]
MLTFAKIKNIGIILTRYAGTDGVTLETRKWCHVLERMGYNCYFFAGESDSDSEMITTVPEAFFDHPGIQKIQKKCFGSFTRTSRLTGRIHHMRKIIKKELYNFLEKYSYSIDMLIVENALTIPMNIPLGLAITELIAETGIPTIAHHHDFYWERERFMVNSVRDLLATAFPPNLPSMQHVVINSQADNNLSYRTGISSHIIPNVFQYAASAPSIDDYNKDVRKDLGMEEDDIIFLQPTRIVPRKGIEHSIEVLNRLKNPKAKLVITHSAGDEGMEYQDRIISYAKLLNVPLIIKPEIIGSERKITPDGRKIYTTWDIYPHADFVTYPSLYEGFGNAFLEAIFFKKPILVNRYSIYQQDIEPIGFDVVSMDGYVTDEVVRKIRYILRHPEEKKRSVNRNYELASRFFSYDVLEQKLSAIISNFEGTTSERKRKAKQREFSMLSEE